MDMLQQGFDGVWWQGLDKVDKEWKKKPKGKGQGKRSQDIEPAIHEYWDHQG